MPPARRLTTPLPFAGEGQYLCCPTEPLTQQSIFTLTFNPQLPETTAATRR